MAVDLAHRGVDGWTTIYAIGACAPFALLAGAFASATARGLRDVAERRLVRQARAAWSESAGSDRVAALLAIGLALVVASGLGLIAGRAVVSAIRSPTYAAAAVLLAGAGGLGVGLATALSLWPLLSRASKLVAARASSIVRPLVALAAAAVVGGTISWVSGNPLLRDGFPWLRAAVIVLVALSCALLVSRTSKESRFRGAAIAVSSLALVLAGLSLWSPRLLLERRSVLLAHGSAGGRFMMLGSRLLDFDGDGAASAYGGGDCAPFDPARGPHALEIPDNDLDEDCSGLDAKSATFVAERGASHHPRSPRGEKRPHVILVTTDGLSFDHTNLSSYPREVTPHLRAWSRRATTFDAAYSTSSATCNALPALFTGLPALAVPGLLPPRNQAAVEGATRETLAQVLSRSGYRTVALPGAAYFAAAEWPSLLGTFDEVDTTPLDAATSRARGAKPHAAPDLVERALALLSEPSGGPLFLWVHFFDHHAPYEIPSGAEAFGGGRSDIDRYDTELRFADQHWGALFEGIEARLAPEDYILIFTSDHGEAFDADHPRDHHDSALVAAETHVPLVVQTSTARGTSRRGLASHLDVVPTVVDILSLDPRHGLFGESLAPVLLDGREPEKTFVLSLLFQPRGGPLGAPALRSSALRTRELLYVDDREHDATLLIDERADPLAHHDRTAARPAEAEWARYVLRDQLERAKQGAP